MTVFRAALLVGAVVCLPYLGAVGLWDPWETHYAEVGRQMLARADLVHPFWQDAYFFSKPPLVPWLAALSLFLSGAQPWGAPGAGPLPEHVEWLVRLPIALMLLFAIALLADAVAAHATRRAGLLTAAVLWTMPLVDFLARQVMTDGPLVACLVIALACALRERWFGFFAATGVALLAKGLLGFLPFVLVPAWWLLMEGKGAWARVRALPAWGVPLTLLIGAPWYVAMSRFEGRDDEGRRFFERFFLSDHLDRLVSGVHTTTPGGSFTYFLEQGAWALAPWVFVLPLVVTVRRAPLANLMALGAVTTFTLFTASATRFHHYVLPVLPFIGVLLALVLDELLTQGLEQRRVALLASLPLGALVWKDLWQRPRHLLDLFTYNHERPYPDEVLTAPLDLRRALLVAVVALVAVLLVALWKKRARLYVGALLTFAAACALVLSWQHWPALGRHWTQRELMRTYFAKPLTSLPASPPGALIAFLMNWKGETFYSRNAVKQVSARDPRGELQALLAPPGPEFVLVEHARLGLLRSLLLPTQRAIPLAPETTNKFVLVRIDDATESYGLRRGEGLQHDDGAGP